MPICLDRIAVIQICNSNAITDDNFNIYLNNTYIGFLDLNADDYIGSIFLGTLDPNINIVESDLICPLSGMAVYRFDDALLNIGQNILEMRNVQENFKGNVGSVGVRTYELNGNDLVNPQAIVDLPYAGSGGESFTFDFEFTCDGIPTTTTTTTVDPNTTSTTTTQPTTTAEPTTPTTLPPTSTDSGCCCDCPTTAPPPLILNELIFTIPTTIAGTNITVETTPINDVVILTTNILLTTTTTPPVVLTTTVSPTTTTTITVKEICECIPYSNCLNF